MKRFITLIFLVVSIYNGNAQRLYSQYVNTFIGTGGHGHTYPGAVMPYGLVQLSPDTRLDGWDGCSGYHYSDDTIYGFSHTHLSGTGCFDYGDLLIMPYSKQTGTEKYWWKSAFSHEKESATPGYYNVILDKENIRAELTVSLRAGFHRYSFPQNQPMNLVIELDHRDKILDASLQQISPTEIAGFRISRHWAEEQHFYFVIRFSQPIIGGNVASANQVVKAGQGKIGTSTASNQLLLNFGLAGSKPLLVKVGVSSTSIEGARKNLEAEIPEWNFDEVVANAAKVWNKELSKIEVESDDFNKLMVFYSALYHCMVAPNVWSDADGQYRGMDNRIHSGEGFTRYTVFSLWDTYRALHPLLTLIDTARTREFILTFLSMQKESGLLPVWELAANETQCMIGYHTVPVIVDAWLKGIKGFDPAVALEAMKASANQDKHGIDAFRKYGYIPTDKEKESVSKTLEYAYDDWCIAQMAKYLGNETDYQTFIKRAQGWKHLFNPETGFIQPRQSGGWYRPFVPTEVNMNYTEANAWQYNFYVPQDLATHIRMMGGKEAYAKKLDSCFFGKTILTGRNQSDITGLIGQYAHGNEPSHHMAYLYNYIEKPHKTQQLVWRIMNELYTHQPDGLSGNEDCGQMSAWLVFSAMGFYPVCPGSNQYIIGRPLFRKCTIKTEAGKEFTIVAHNFSSNNLYIASAKLNGKPFSRSFLYHNEIVEGGYLELFLASTPSETFGIGDGNYPVTVIVDNQIVPAPIIDAPARSFNKKLKVTLKSLYPETKLFYTLDGSQPTNKSAKYKKLLVLKKDAVVQCIAWHPSLGFSPVSETEFIKHSITYKIISQTPYSSQYNGGGPGALTDGIKGNNNFRLGGWQGFEGINFEAIIDLNKVQPVQKVTARFIQDAGAYIMFPLSVSFSFSNDGQNWSEPVQILNKIPDTEMKAIIQEFAFNKSVTARYVKILAVNHGPLPAWHAGAGDKSWLFIDEIDIK